MLQNLGRNLHMFLDNIELRIENKKITFSNNFFFNYSLRFVKNGKIGPFKDFEKKRKKKKKSEAENLKAHESETNIMDILRNILPNQRPHYTMKTVFPKLKFLFSILSSKFYRNR